MESVNAEPCGGLVIMISTVGVSTPLTVSFFSIKNNKKRPSTPTHVHANRKKADTSKRCVFSVRL